MIPRILSLPDIFYENRFCSCVIDGVIGWAIEVQWNFILIASEHDDNFMQRVNVKKTLAHIICTHYPELELKFQPLAE